MFRYLGVLAFLLCCASTATASTWYTFAKAWNDELMFFFDADTVVKNGDTIKIWTKSVNNEKHPSNNGSYSQADRSEYSCKKRTDKPLSSSTYGKDGVFIRSFEGSKIAREITPDSLDEHILEAICTSDFPRSKSDKLYYPVKDNDVLRHASVFYKNREEMYTDLAPKESEATWYVFNHAYNDNKVYYFDVNTISKVGDTVSIWAKYVNNIKHLDSDGSYSTALKVLFSCTKNTAQLLKSSIYDKDNKFIKSYPAALDPSVVSPGSFNEVILKAVCASDFPKDISSEQYFAVDNNDIYQATYNFYAWQEAQKKDLAPK